MKYIKDLRAQVSVTTILPLVVAVSVVLSVGYLLLSKTPQVQALVYVPALITMASCLLYFWLVVLDNSRTKRQINEYLMLMNHPPPDVPKSEVPVGLHVGLQASLERIIALLEQSKEPQVVGGNKELMTSVCEVIDEGLKKHANTMHKANNQHIEYIVSTLNDIVSERLKPGIDAIVSELTKTNASLSHADKQTQASMLRLVNAITDLKTFMEDFERIGKPSTQGIDAIVSTLNGIVSERLKPGIDAIVSELTKTNASLSHADKQTQASILQLVNAITDLKTFMEDFERIGKPSTQGIDAQETCEKLIDRINSTIERQLDTLNDSAQAANLIRESAALLAETSSDVKGLTEGLVKSTYLQERLCVNFNGLFREIEGRSMLNAHEELKKFIDDIASSLSKTSESIDKQNTRLLEWTNNIDQHTNKLSAHSTIAHENLERLIPLINSAIEKQADTLNDSTHMVNLIRESAVLLAGASGDVRCLTEGLVKSSDSQERLYINFKDLFKEIEGISKLNTRLLAKEQVTFKELEGTIEKTLTNLVIQTDVFTVHTTEWLNRFINDVTSGLSKTSGSMDKQTTRLMEWTNIVDQQISKLSTQSTITQEGFKKLVSLINSAIEKQANTIEDSSRAVNLIKESAVLLVSASTGVKGLTDGLIKSADTQEKLYANFRDMLRDIEGKSTLNTQLLEQEKLTFKELEATIERLLSNLIKQTDIFTGRTTDGLSRFINDINSGLSGSVNGLRGVIHVQTELVDEISSVLVQLNDKLKG
ncbi:membrane protein [Candidatus Magnetobacterium bavaricum]|uniref:Membrane protein n=1 Tax=Candidatus Magnetobacterium bavaricum TaxID=29290 RepID=A0A0F3GTJ1_9BACT|nr:membrane protein [Candidatus Magnetobacterium bavaricum]KJU85162.1 membrane protein [Candidatus Magnetobacterium bavaricum]